MDLTKLSLENFIKKMSEDFNYRVREVLENEFRDDFIRVFSEEYDGAFSSIESIMSKQGDPTAPSKIKPAVISYIRRNFEKAVSFDEGVVTFSLLNGRDLGYPEGPDETETDMVKLFYFYLEGVIGEFAFINNKTYNLINPDRSGKRIGRFGKGFLMHLDTYRKIKTVHSNRDLMPAVEEVRFPMSNMPPSNLIDRVMDKLPLDKYIGLATSKILEGNT
jgi:hypothetical protein